MESEAGNPGIQRGEVLLEAQKRKIKSLNVITLVSSDD